MKEKLFGKTLTELKEITDSLGFPGYTADQMADWLYKKRIRAVSDMTNLSLKNRKALNRNYEVGLTPYTKVQVSTDGTKKYLFPVGSSKWIETAMIPEKTRNTVCISSQVGCKMGCLFCLTGKQGFQEQLRAGDILNQLFSIDESGEITNVVYMGMGEPFDNLTEVLKSLHILTAHWGCGMSPRRITVSSIGILPGMRSFLDQCQAHLAISLHSPFPEERQKLIPAQAAYPLSAILEELKKRDFGKQRRISFEYILFNGLNDTPRHAKALTALLKEIPCRVNLIRFHPFPGTSLTGSSETTLQTFKDSLNRNGILTTLRTSRGEDICAACGLLSTKEKNRPS
jgi:23S rRNA (adenine2503-C2)-methyltransferase